MNYAALIVRQYGEGRLSIITDRISGKNTSHGSNSVTFWRQLLEWNGQRFDGESINVGVIDVANNGAFSALRELHMIRAFELTMQDVAKQDLSLYDVLYFSGLPSTVSDDVHNKIEPYVSNGGGVFVESPDRGEENINILTSIDNIYCKSSDKPLQTNAYWTTLGLSDYSYFKEAKVSFVSSLNSTHLGQIGRF
jgi:hypothetical protein